VVLNTLTGSALAGAILEIFTERIQFPSVSPITLERMRNEYDIGNIATSTLDYYQEILASRATPFRIVAEKSRA
jgi:hypothetical protein